MTRTSILSRKKSQKTSENAEISQAHGLVGLPQEKNGHPTKSNLHIQYNPHQYANTILQRHEKSNLILKNKQTKDIENNY